MTVKNKLYHKAFLQSFPDLERIYNAKDTGVTNDDRVTANNDYQKLFDRLENFVRRAYGVKLSYVKKLDNESKLFYQMGDLYLAAKKLA